MKKSPKVEQNKRKLKRAQLIKKGLRKPPTHTGEQPPKPLTDLQKLKLKEAAEKREPESLSEFAERDARIIQRNNIKSMENLQKNEAEMKGFKGEEFFKNGVGEMSAENFKK